MVLPACGCIKCPEKKCNETHELPLRASLNTLKISEPDKLSGAQNVI